jgi:hypothetical protein
MRTALFALLATAAIATFAASPRLMDIDMDQDLGGMDIEVKAIPGAVTVVTLNNKAKQKADCVASFEGGFATPVRRGAMVQPGKTATLSYTLKDDIARLKVTLRCKPAA